MAGTLPIARDTLHHGGAWGWIFITINDHRTVVLSCNGSDAILRYFATANAAVMLIIKFACNALLTFDLSMEAFGLNRGLYTYGSFVASQRSEGFS